MAAPRREDSGTQGGPKRSYFSRRSRSSSPRRAVLNTSRSPSPRGRSTRKTQEMREVDRRRDRDFERDHDRDRDRGRNRNRDDDDRMTSREKFRPRERTRGNSRERDRSRERRPRDRTRDQSPVRPRRDRSSSPRDMRQRRGPSPKESPPRLRNAKESPRRHHRMTDDQQITTGARSAARDEAVDAANGGDRENGSTPKETDAVSKMKEVEAALEEKAKEKEKPSFEYSGKLAAETNKVRGVTLLFSEPPEARKPTIRWRLYVFKDGEPLNDPLYIHRQTCYLFGRERRVADIPTDHPSCSKQHAVIQYRLTEKEEPSGLASNKIRPYIMDLGSTNGTFINSERVEAQRYYEICEKDTIKFGNSSREYVLLHEHSTG